MSILNDETQYLIAVITKKLNGVQLDILEEIGTPEEVLNTFINDICSGKRESMYFLDKDSNLEEIINLHQRNNLEFSAIYKLDRHGFIKCNDKRQETSNLINSMDLSSWYIVDYSNFLEITRNAEILSILGG